LEKISLHILIVTQYFWPEVFRINDLAQGLVERGHEVTVLTGIPNYPGGAFFPGYSFYRNLREIHQGVNIIRVPLISRGDGGGARLVLNYLSFALLASVLAPLLCRRKYDLIFVYQLSPVTVGIPATVFKTFRQIPIFFWIQDIWPESLSATGAVKSQKILCSVKKLVSFIYKRCDRILIQSPAFSPLIECLNISPEKISYFPNSVEKLYTSVASEHLVEIKAKLPSGFTIMFAGNIGAAQDFPTIIGAARKLRDYPDINWVILGDGRVRTWLESEIDKYELNDKVHLLGLLPMESMPYYFSAADVMLVTLRNEPIFSLTIPSKIQSYLACGRPIVAALSGEGGRVVVESGAGFASTPEDIDALAESILAMYRMPKDEREMMGRRGKEYCEANFGREMLIDRLEGWMKEMCDGNHGRS
jgi:colanic acid biosynthesis glycosyl transferase WcaI